MAKKILFEPENLPVRLIICGDRKGFNANSIKKRLIRIFKKNPKMVVITGSCRGVDEIADWIAEELGIDRIKYPANWTRDNKAAGPIRNRRQMKDGRATRVWAFHRDISKSKGTKDMVNAARKAGIPAEVFDK